MTHFYYFGYGSNLLHSEICRSCSSAVYHSIGKLRGKKLNFTVHSVSRNGGVADIVPDNRNVVWGVIWKIDAKQLGDLDQREGFVPGRPPTQNLYNRHNGIEVMTLDSQLIPVCVYDVEPSRRKTFVKPSLDYAKLIWQGANENSLPYHYRRKLRTQFGSYGYHFK